MRTVERKRSQGLKRFVAFVTFITFLSTNVSSKPLFAAQGSFAPKESASFQDLNQIRLPKAFGKIDSSVKGNKDRTVIVVQDAHEIPSAQKSIYKIIKYLTRTYGIKLVGVEGANARLNGQIFKSFPNKKKLKQVFGDYFDKGELAGAVAAEIFARPSDNIGFHGIEDWNLYEQGLEFFLKSLESENLLLEKITAEEQKLDSEKKKSFSPQLFAIDSAWQKFQENQGDLNGLLKLLSAVKKPEDKEILAVVEEIESQGANSIDAQMEAGKIAAKLKADLISKSANKELALFNQKKQLFQTSQLSPQAFVLEMKQIAVRQGIRFNIPKSLKSGVQNQRTMKQMEGTRFFQSLEAYVESVKTQLITDVFQKELSERTRRISLLKKLTKLELTQDEWKEVRDSGASEFTSAEEAAIFKNASAQFSFYQTAEKRDGAFLNKLDKVWAENPKSKASIMISGGFHAQGLVRHLTEQGFSVILIMPSIPQIPAEINYRDHMRGNVSWKNYFEVEEGKINLYKAFVRGTRDKLLKRQDAEGIDPRLLKEWRDQIIRDLAEQNKIETAGDYTRFLDEVAGDTKKSKLNTWMEKIHKFVAGLHKLESEKQLNEQNIYRLMTATQGTLIMGSTDVTTSLPSQDLLAVEAARPEIRTTAAELVAKLPKNSWGKFPGYGITVEASREYPYTVKIKIQAPKTENRAAVDRNDNFSTYRPAEDGDIEKILIAYLNELQRSHDNIPTTWWGQQWNNFQGIRPFEEVFEGFLKVYLKTPHVIYLENQRKKAQSDFPLDTESAISVSQAADRILEILRNTMYRPIIGDAPESRDQQLNQLHTEIGSRKFADAMRDVIHMGPLGVREGDFNEGLAVHLSPLVKNHPELMHEEFTPFLRPEIRAVGKDQLVVGQAMVWMHLVNVTAKVIKSRWVDVDGNVSVEFGQMKGEQRDPRLIQGEAAKAIVEEKFGGLAVFGEDFAKGVLEKDAATLALDLNTQNQMLNAAVAQYYLVRSPQPKSNREDLVDMIKALAAIIDYLKDPNSANEKAAKEAVKNFTGYDDAKDYLDQFFARRIDDLFGKESIAADIFQPRKVDFTRAFDFGAKLDFGTLAARKEFDFTQFAQPKLEFKMPEGGFFKQALKALAIDAGSELGRLREALAARYAGQNRVTTAEIVAWIKENAETVNSFHDIAGRVVQAVVTYSETTSKIFDNTKPREADGLYPVRPEVANDITGLAAAAIGLSGVIFVFESAEKIARESGVPLGFAGEADLLARARAYQKKITAAMRQVPKVAGEFKTTPLISPEKLALIFKSVTDDSTPRPEMRIAANYASEEIQNTSIDQLANRLEQLAVARVDESLSSLTDKNKVRGAIAGWGDVLRNLQNQGVVALDIQADITDAELRDYEQAILAAKGNLTQVIIAGDISRLNVKAFREAGINFTTINRLGNVRQSQLTGQNSLPAVLSGHEKFANELIFGIDHDNTNDPVLAIGAAFLQVTIAALIAAENIKDAKELQSRKADLLKQLFGEYAGRDDVFTVNADGSITIKTEAMRLYIEFKATQVAGRAA